MWTFGRPRKLDTSDSVSGFHSGHVDLDDWLARFALTNQQSGMTTVFVSTAGRRIAGYYALSTGGLDHASAPTRVTTGVPRHPIPVIILTRLAVDSDFSRRGLGRALVRDALARVIRAADEIGISALLVHAKDAQAREFYEHLAEFDTSPTDPLHLVLLLKDARRAVLGRS